jgi:hypothetical protein
MASLILNRPAARVECSATAADTADYRQAEYFLGLLAQNRGHIDHRIGDYRKAIAAAEAVRDSEAAIGLRRMARIEEQDRHTVDVLIANLRRRFPLAVPGEVPPVPRRARLAVR